MDNQSNGFGAGISSDEITRTEREWSYEYNLREDIVCVNADSRRVTDFVMKNDTCEFWEAEEGK